MQGAAPAGDRFSRASLALKSARPDPVTLTDGHKPKKGCVRMGLRPADRWDGQQQVDFLFAICPDPQVTEALELPTAVRRNPPVG